MTLVPPRTSARHREVTPNGACAICLHNVEAPSRYCFEFNARSRTRRACEQPLGQVAEIAVQSRGHASMSCTVASGPAELPKRTLVIGSVQGSGCET